MCIGALPIGLAQAKVCAKFTDPRAIAVCTAVIGAYIWICRSNSARRTIKWIYDSFTKERFAVNITASHPKFGSKTVQINVIPQSEPLPATEISFGERAVINSVTTIPVDPAPNENYMFIVETFCAAPGTQVELSIVGTDGYTDSEIDSLDGSTTQATLEVPGAEERIVDTLTARFLPNGDQRVITIVF